jgi:uncharacterized protein YndB with AHSA1/START domain
MTVRPDTETRRTEFVITRSFDAPRDLVWQAVSESERLAQWWGPKGFTVTVFGFEFRPGGIFHYRMENPGGFTMWGKFTYREITAPERIVFVNAFSDEAGNLTRAPFFDGRWPLEILNTLTLSERDGATTVTLRSHPIDATDDEVQTFKSNLPSMGQGFGNAFDQLEEHLAKTQANA